jgi:histidyl-tRNA synthetase
MRNLIVIYLNKEYADKAYMKIANYTGDYRLEFSNDFDYDKPFKSRMKNAENYDFAAIVGDEEFKNDSVTLKNMVSGKQKLVKYWEIYDNLK